MIRKVAEEHHHTAEQVESYVNEAIMILANCNVPDDLREAAFTEAVRLLSAKQLWHEQVAAGMTIPGNRLHG